MSTNLIAEIADQARLVRLLQKRYFKERRQSTFKECLFQEHELDRLIDLWDDEITLLQRRASNTQPALELPSINQTTGEIYSVKAERKSAPMPDSCPKCWTQFTTATNGDKICPACGYEEHSTTYPVRTEG